jgi:hypothetical protein
MELDVGSLRHRISLNDRKLSADTSNESPEAFPKGCWGTGKGFADSLWFLSAENAVGTYPDTGESGDAYDAEALVDCWPLESQGLVAIVNSLL